MYCMTYSPSNFLFSINNISVSVNNSNSTSAFLKYACHANPDADTKRAGSNSFISIHLFRIFSNTSAHNNVS